MAETEAPLPPIEIPWRLAATTQPLAVQAAETAMSLFFFEPDDPALTSRFPDEKLVYLKVTASISPAAFPAALSRVAASFLGEAIPCLHLLLDLKVRKEGGDLGSVRPYFHAASPLSRKFVQTGVIGADMYEGEADGLAIGKSGSQLHETLRSHSRTTSASASTGFSLGPVSLGGSVRTTGTDLSSDRSVGQVVDTTSRQASEERRELISHTTRVENVISLLSAKYVGTPHLSFSLSPQPLQLLSIDPSDPNLWFQQLLSRRSSGIEGIQEFTAVLVVPKDMDFCVQAQLRRVCLLDSPPGPLSFEEKFNGKLAHIGRMWMYLNRVFPAGTPLADLDVDIIGGLAEAGKFRRPVVSLWEPAVGPDLFVANVKSPSATPAEVDEAKEGRVAYKHFLEVWLDTLVDEYEREASRSPLERGVLFGENRFLDTCFGTAPEGGGTVVTSSKTSTSPLFRVPLDRGMFDIGGIKTLSTAQTGSTRSRAFETVTRWAALEGQVTTLLANRKQLDETVLAANDPEVLGVLHDTWRKLAPDDPRNVPLDQAVAMLGLSPGHRGLLAAAGAAKLSDVAGLLQAVPQIEQQNAEGRQIAKRLKKRKGAEPPPREIPLPFGSSEAAAITGAIAKALGSSADRAPD